MTELWSSHGLGGDQEFDRGRLNLRLILTFRLPVDDAEWRLDLLSFGTHTHRSERFVERLLSSSEAPIRLPKRDIAAHKGSYGTLLVIAGSSQLGGAAALVADGALRAGVGLVRLAVPWGIVERLATNSPERIVIGQRQESDGGLAFTALPDLRQLLSTASAVVIGPGMGQSAGRSHLIRQLLESIKQPAVLDADGLNLLAEIGITKIAKFGRNWILTPHPKEASRLLDIPIEKVLDDRRNAVATLARSTGAVVVLKGHQTLIANGTSDDIFINTTGNPNLAVGGTGDVLTGVIGALLAMGLPTLDATLLGVWAHGRAADRLLVAGRSFGVKPTELAKEITFALSEASL